MGNPPSLAPADQGSTSRRQPKSQNEHKGAQERRCEPGSLPGCDPPRVLSSRSSSARLDQLSGCSLCTASARPSEAHHNLAYYREAAIPATLYHWLRCAAFASAVISIRQDCNTFEANLQETCTRPLRIELISTAAPGTGASQESLCSGFVLRWHAMEAHLPNGPSQSARGAPRVPNT